MKVIIGKIQNNDTTPSSSEESQPPEEQLQSELTNQAVLRHRPGNQACFSISSGKFIKADGGAVYQEPGISNTRPAIISLINNQNQTNKNQLYSFFITKPIATIVDLEQFIQYLLKEYPEDDIRIEDEFDVEEQTQGFLQFEDGKLVAYSECSSILSGFAVVLKYYYPNETIQQAATKATAIQATSSNSDHSAFYWREALSAFFALGASTKQLIGTNNFFREIAHADADLALALGIITAIPAFAFYYRSNIAIASKWPIPSKADTLAAFTRFKQYCQCATCCKDSEAFSAHNFRSVLISLFNGIWGNYLTSLKFYERLADFVLGTGYGGANLGMVWEAFPNEMNVVVIKEVILFCIFMTNWQVGIDKSHKVTAELIHKIQSLKQPDDEVAKLENNMLDLALNNFADMLKVAEKLGIDNTNTISQLKQSFTDCQTVRAYWQKVVAAISELQTNIDQKKFANYQNRSSATESTTLLEYDSEKQQLPCDAQNAYFKAEAIFQETWSKTAKGLSLFGTSVAFAGIVSNIGGVSALLATAGWQTGLVQLIVSFLLSQGAFGMNLQATEDMKNTLLAKLTENVTVEVNTRAKTWADSGISVASIAGLLMSTLAATQGVYYTKIAFDQKILADMSGPLMELIKYYCVSSTGLMMAVTKAVPTSDLFTSLYQRLVRTATHASITANEELTKFQNQTIKLLVDGLRDLVVAYNKLINGAPRSFQQNFGLVKIDVLLYSRQVCDELAVYTERTDIITYLNNKLTELRNDFIKAHHANEINKKLPDFQPAENKQLLEERFSEIQIVTSQQ